MLNWWHEIIIYRKKRANAEYCILKASGSFPTTCLKGNVYPASWKLFKSACSHAASTFFKIGHSHGTFVLGFLENKNFNEAFDLIVFLIINTHSMNYSISLVEICLWIKWVFLYILMLCWYHYPFNFIEKNVLNLTSFCFVIWFIIFITI